MAKDKQKNLLPGEVPEELTWIDNVTDLLDSKFRIPGTKITFGLDPIIGLVPYFGEVVSFGISGLLVLSMVRHGVSGKVILKMLGNLTIDAITGLVPGLGDLFDVFYKANRRNFKLLEQHQVEGKHEGSGWPILLGVTLVILIMMAFMIWGMIAVTQWFGRLF
ncbi:MAG: DUF4112 domain-containing protein [Bacteroidetes bacterium]|nr:DUF4112 domain-containing protein [Bacteroidota bacterium]